MKRAIPSDPDASGEVVQWNEQHPVDANLLPLLNRYCYRCHSSFRYNVFDKQGVLTALYDLKTYVEEGVMPPDRVLPADVRDQLLELLGKLEE